MHIEFIVIDGIPRAVRVTIKVDIIKSSMPFRERRFGFRWSMPRHRFGPLVVVIVGRGEIAGSNDLSEIERIEGAADCV